MRPVAISTLGARLLLSNYGTFFQHYALRKVLRGLGFAPFRLLHSFDRYDECGFVRSWCKDAIRPFIWMLKGVPNWKLLARQLVEWDVLNLLFLFEYRRLVGCLREAQEVDCDTIGVMGGDQIMGDKSERMWLSVIPDANKCIAYAASTDWTRKSADNDWCEFAKRQLRRFTAIGLREMAGIELCRNFVSRDKVIGHVADPVMLLSVCDYDEIASAKSQFERPTLFCYFVNIRTIDDLRIDEYLHLAELLGCELKIVGIQGAEMFVPSKYRLRLRPSQFLRAMKDARYVVTNSYHGSVFSMLFKKKFLSVWQNCPPGTNQNGRQKELMLQFGLCERWVDWRSCAEEWYDTLTAPVDWVNVQGKLDEFRQVSFDWLKSALVG